MRNTRMIALALTCLLAAGSGIAADGESNATTDRAAIEAAARDYIDGWYEGDAERMARGLHPDLVKRTIRPLPNGRGILQHLSSATMIEYTRAGLGKKSKKEGQVNEVIILDQLSVTASVKFTIRTLDRKTMSLSVSLAAGGASTPEPPPDPDALERSSVV